MDVQEVLHKTDGRTFRMQKSLQANLTPGVKEWSYTAMVLE
jgi:hypothetical protein